MSRVSLALLGFTVVGVLAVAGCGSDATPQPTVTVTAPAPATTAAPGTPLPPTTPAPPTRATDAQVYATWVQAGGGNAVARVVTEQNASAAATSCSAVTPILQAIIADAQKVIDFAPAPPGSVATPLNAAMEHLQNSARAEVAYCAAPSGSAEETAAKAQADSELQAAQAALTQAKAAAAPFESSTSTTDNSQAA